MCLHLWKRENSRKQKKKQINKRKRRKKKPSHRDWVYECALRNSRASSLSSIFPASIILLGAQSILGWWSVIVAPLFRIWGFPGFSPEKWLIAQLSSVVIRQKPSRIPSVAFFASKKTTVYDGHGSMLLERHLFQRFAFVFGSLRGQLLP